MGHLVRIRRARTSHADAIVHLYLTTIRGSFMELQAFQRRPSYVKAIQVTEENIADLAKFCNGRLKGVEANAHHSPRILLPEYKEGNQSRQLVAYIGDWLVQTRRQGFRSYKDEAFQKYFVSL